MIYNLNLDDVTPIFRYFDYFYELVERVPEIKVTMFVPINKMDYPGNNDLLKNPDWCKELEKLPKKNFEISPHGYYHTTRGRVPEFYYLDYDKANRTMKMCENAFKDMGITFVKGFRPPMWRLSRATVDVLKDRGYLYLADTPRNLQYQEIRKVSIPRIYSNDDIYSGMNSDEIRGYEKLLPDRNRFLLQRGHIISRAYNNLFDRQGEIVYKKGENYFRLLKTISGLKNPEFKFLSELVNVELT
jgi:predicted deacetylase